MGRSKETVLDSIRRLPDDVSRPDIDKENECIAGVREGSTQLDRGEGVSLEDAEKKLSPWLTE